MTLLWASHSTSNVVLHVVSCDYECCWSLPSRMRSVSVFVLCLCLSFLLCLSVSLDCSFFSPKPCFFLYLLSGGSASVFICLSGVGDDRNTAESAFSSQENKSLCRDPDQRKYLTCSISRAKVTTPCQSKSPNTTLIGFLIPACSWYILWRRDADVRHYFTLVCQQALLRFMGLYLISFCFHSHAFFHNLSLSLFVHFACVCSKCACNWADWNTICRVCV